MPCAAPTPAAEGRRSMRAESRPSTVGGRAAMSSGERAFGTPASSSHRRTSSTNKGLPPVRSATAACTAAGTDWRAIDRIRAPASSGPRGPSSKWWRRSVGTRSPIEARRAADSGRPVTYSTSGWSPHRRARSTVSAREDGVHPMDVLDGHDRRPVVGEGLQQGRRRRAAVPAGRPRARRRASRRGRGRGDARSTGPARPPVRAGRTSASRGPTRSGIWPAGMRRRCRSSPT